MIFDRKDIPRLGASRKPLTKRFQGAIKVAAATAKVRAIFTEPNFRGGVMKGRTRKKFLLQGAKQNPPPSLTLTNVFWPKSGEGYVCMHLCNYIYVYIYIQHVASFEPKKIEPIASSAGRMSFLKKWHSPCSFFFFHKMHLFSRNRMLYSKRNYKTRPFGGIIWHKFAIFLHKLSHNTIKIGIS